MMRCGNSHSLFLSPSGSRLRWIIFALAVFTFYTVKEGGNGAVGRLLMEEVQSPTLATRTKDTQQQYTGAGISSAKDISDLHSPDLQRLAEEEERVHNPSKAAKNNNNDKIIATTIRSRMPTNINVAMLGDSTTRFAYISLAYYLHTGNWIDPVGWGRQDCNPMEAITCTGDKWATFNRQVSALMGQHEFCDCTRGDFDSRYYYDPELNNRLSFFFRGGHSHQAPFRGRVDSALVWKDFANRTGLPFGQTPHQPHAWEHHSWADMIRHELGRMNPVPQYLVLNAGLWKHHFGNATLRQEVLEAAREVGISKVVWRTTAHQIPDWKSGGNETYRTSEETDRAACQMFDGCVDVAPFTQHIHRDYLNDHRHFREPVNRIFNEETLLVLGYLPKGYKRLDPGVLAQKFDANVLRNAVRQAS